MDLPLPPLDPAGRKDARHRDTRADAVVDRGMSAAPAGLTVPPAEPGAWPGINRPAGLDAAGRTERADGSHRQPGHQLELTCLGRIQGLADQQ